MPSRSQKQHKLMEAAAHTPGGYGGVPQSVGAEFAAADKATRNYQGKGAAGSTSKRRTGKTRAYTGK